MGENILLADTWANTNIKVLKTTFIWKFGNFSYCTKKAGEKVYSPYFTSGNDELRWCLNMYPNGMDSEDYIELYINLMNCYQREIKAQYKFSVLNKKGEVAYYTQWSSKCEFSQGSSWGFSKFISRDYLLKNADNLLPNDVFTTYCEVYAGISFENSTFQNNKMNLATNYIQSDLTNDYNVLWQNPIYSDITLLINGKKHLAHKCILSARSSYFRKMFEEHSKIGNQLHIIELVDFDELVMLDILKYIYSGKFEQSNILGNKFIAAAVKYDLKGLITKCEEKLTNGLNVNNAAEILIAADLYKFEKLKAEAVQFIVKHGKSVITTPGYLAAKTSHPHLFIEVFNKMAEASNSKQKKNKNKKKKPKQEPYYDDYDYYYDDDDDNDYYGYDDADDDDYYGYDDDDDDDYYYYDKDEDEDEDEEDYNYNYYY